MSERLLRWDRVHWALMHRALMHRDWRDGRSLDNGQAAVVAAPRLAGIVGDLSDTGPRGNLRRHAVVFDHIALCGLLDHRSHRHGGTGVVVLRGMAASGGRCGQQGGRQNASTVNAADP
jgi:hypothetical protein